MNFNIWKSIILLIGIAAAFSLWKNNFKNGGSLSRNEFRDYKKEFRAEIDTLNFKLDRNSFKIDTLLSNDKIQNLNIDSLKIGNQTILYNLDSLKKGQIIIYRKLSDLKEDKAEDKKFINKLKNWFYE
ncbi:MAG: hypothetical protein L3J35_03595 [Bacteroidales bacterium]|nr:hypothetical protein [Bacteroidales bacterium]